MPNIEIYTTANCPYCVRAKMLLQGKNVSWEEIRVDEDPNQKDHMIERSGRRSVPQIFIGDQHIGGFDDLAELDRRGELEPLLAAR